MRPSILRAFRLLATTAVVAAVAPAAPALAVPGSCPGGEKVCVYLPAGTYTLGNPVTYYTGSAPSTYTVLRHCNSTGTVCDETTLRLNGYSISSTPGTVLTLTVPGEGVGLSGITPTLYLGSPQPGIGSTAAGVTLTVSGTAFVVWDSSLNFLQFKCQQIYVPPIFGGTPSVGGTFSPCHYSFTVDL